MQISYDNFNSTQIEISDAFNGLTNTILIYIYRVPLEVSRLEKYMEKYMEWSVSRHMAASMMWHTVEYMEDYMEEYALAKGGTGL